jgi:glycosyltransferase, group 1 family
LKDEDKLRVDSLVGDSKRIRIYNAVDQVHLGEIMRHKDIFILPSYFEGLGLIAVEALGSGLRVVATEIEGLIEFLGEKINNSEIIEYVKMPTIYDTDKAVEEEKPAFVERLVGALEVMIERTRKEREIPAYLLEEIERHSWKKKIETIYKLL